MIISESVSGIKPNAPSGATVATRSGGAGRAGEGLPLGNIAKTYSPDSPAEGFDPETGEILNRVALNEELEKIEKPAGISNPKDFRNEIVNFVLRARANNNGKNPTWLSYEKLRVVIEKKMFSNTEDLLPVISFNAKASKEDQQKHNDFITRMVERGYTEKQVRLLSEWYLRVRKSQ